MNLQNIVHIAELVCQGLGGLCLLATIIVRMTPSTADDAILDTVDGYFFKLISFLPTIGVNPNTTQLVNALKEAQEPAAVAAPAAPAKAA